MPAVFRFYSSGSFVHTLLCISSRATSSIIRLLRNLTSCRNKRCRRRESKNAGFHGGPTRRAREREGRSEARDRHGRKLVSFVKFLERKVTPRHLSRSRRLPRLLSLRPTGSGTCRGWFESFQRKYYSRIRPCTLRPSIHRDLNRLLYSSQTAFNYRSTLSRVDSALWTSDIKIMSKERNEIVTKLPFNEAAI